MKANKQQLCSKLNSNLSTFLTIMLILVFLSFFFSISKYFSFLLAIPIALVSTLFLVILKKKKGSKNESVAQEKLLKEKLQPSTEFNNIQSENTENHKEQAEAQLEYSFPLDSDSRNFLVVDRTFEFSVPEHMQQDDLRSDSSFPSDSERSNGSIVGETFEFDHNRYQNLRSHDMLVSDTDDEDGEYDYDDHDEGFNRIIIDTNHNLNGKEGSLLSYSSLVYPISGTQFFIYLFIYFYMLYFVSMIIMFNPSDDNDYEVEDEDEEDNLIEIDLPSRNLSNLAEESKQKLESRPDLISESIFNQQSLIQLLAEMNDMNEDENLIEIDISR